MANNPRAAENLNPWKPGQSGNPGGKTSEQRKAEVKAAELAAKAQEHMLEALTEHVASDPVAALESIKADPLRLIKDAMDRAHGMPEQTINKRDTSAVEELRDFIASKSDRPTGEPSGE